MPHGDDKVNTELRRPSLAKQKGHAVGADAEKHDMPEGKDARVTQQDVETGHQHGKNHDLQGQVNGLE